LPTLVLRALRRPRLVFEVAIVIGIAECLRPFHEASRRVPMPADDRLVAGPRVQVPQSDDEHEGACVVGVVRGVRVDVQERERPASNLIGDPSWLFVTPYVVSIAL